MVAPPRTPLRVDRLRALNAPRPVTVELSEYGRPRAIMGDDQSHRAIETIGEAWRVDDEWWRQPISRRCFEVLLEGGKRMVLFEDLTTNQWWMQQP